MALINYMVSRASIELKYLAQSLLRYVSMLSAETFSTASRPELKLEYMRGGFNAPNENILTGTFQNPALPMDSSEMHFDAFIDSKDEQS